MSFDSFSLILTKSDTTQQEHIDLLHPLSQYALTISNDVDTTIAYRVKKEIGEVNSMISLCNQLYSELCANGTKADKFKNVFKKIKEIDSDLAVRQMIEIDGFGKLFQIRMTNKEKGTNKKTKFERAYIKHAPTATYTRIKGGMVHSGSGVVGDCVRGILFWSGKPLGIKNMYDPDVQQTMFSVMIEIIQEVWIVNTHESNLRREMVELLYHVYNLCGRNYRKNGQGYRNAKIEEMIDKFNNAKPSAKTTTKMIDDLAAKLDLFE
jgi:nucleoid DNA-binding protein